MRLGGVHLSKLAAKFPHNEAKWLCSKCLNGLRNDEKNGVSFLSFRTKEGWLILKLPPWCSEAYRDRRMKLGFSPHIGKNR